MGLRADRAALCDREDPSGDQTARERGEFLDELGRRADFRDLRLKATNDVSLIEKLSGSRAFKRLDYGKVKWGPAIISSGAKRGAWSPR